MPPVRNLRSSVLFCATTIAFAISFVMLREVLGGESPWLGLLLMFYFMGLAKIGEPLFVFRMPGFIREVRTWELSGSTYQRLGVRQFGRLLRNSPFRFLNSSVYRGRQDLRSLYWHAASAEATHFWAALLFAPYIALVWAREREGVAVLFLFIQIVFNVYPILHLRVVRGRLGAVLGARLRKNLGEANHDSA